MKCCICGKADHTTKQRKWVRINDPDQVEQLTDRLCDSCFTAIRNLPSGPAWYPDRNRMERDIIARFNVPELKLVPPDSPKHRALIREARGLLTEILED